MSERTALVARRKLPVSTPGDRLERDADHIADSAVRSGPTSFFESRLGRPLDDVRFHTDDRAASLASSLHARAFTVGNDVFFARDQFNPTTQRGQRLIAHELAHVVQQQTTGPMIMRDTSTPDEKKGSGADWLKNYFAQYPQSATRLNFFHGTRWSVAKKIPGKVAAVGGGDFAAGFYTHHDKNERKAWFRSLQWGCRVARDAKEKYAGIIKFNVDASKFAALSAKNFNLTSLSQTDYAAKQADWIDFVTSHGREKDPVFQQRRRSGVWIHNRVDPPPPLAYDTITGPFYKPLPGTDSQKPAPADFTPFVEGQDNLPQQVVFANKGCDLLNDASTNVVLTQHECASGNVVDPPDNTAAAGTPSGKEISMIE